MHGAAHTAGQAVNANHTASMPCDHEMGAGSAKAPMPTRPGTPMPAHPCDCPTNCCGAPTVALLSVIGLLPTPPVRDADATSIESAPRRAPSRDRLLPFANGPPAALAD